MRGIRGEAVLRSTWQMRGEVGAAGVGRDGRGGANWYQGRGGESGARGEVEKRMGSFFTGPHWPDVAAHGAARGARPTD